MSVSWSPTSPRLRRRRKSTARLSRKKGSRKGSHASSCAIPPAIASKSGNGDPLRAAKMSVVDLADLKAQLKPGARLLGLDLGEKTIGLALSDTSISIATPMETLSRGKFSIDAAKIDAIVETQG